jgi:hypothetical protein
VILLLDYESNEVLTSLTDNRLVRKGEGRFMALTEWLDEEDQSQIQWLTRMFIFVCCLPPSSARNGVCP